MDGHTALRIKYLSLSGCNLRHNTGTWLCRFFRWADRLWDANSTSSCRPWGSVVASLRGSLRSDFPHWAEFQRCFVFDSYFFPFLGRFTEALILLMLTNPDDPGADRALHQNTVFVIFL